ncbi:MAG: UDP-N-acetylmuramoyl-tripeptide--D-alanyl-D-alanine ligase [Bacillota bacterium]
MALFDLGEITRICRGRLVAGQPEVAVTSVVTDSRQAAPGSLFVCLPGERVDGHEFAGAAGEQGAVAALAQRELAAPGTMGVVMVPDTRQALWDLAVAYRSRFAPRTIAITGSVGKTTTKDIVASILSARFCVLKNEGNLNTEIGLPLTIFRLRPEHQVAVVELAMRGLGQIAQLAELARPEVGIVTNVGEAHLELLGSIENIARAKGELVMALPREGLAVLNGDDPRVRAMAIGAAPSVITYGLSENNDVQGTPLDRKNGHTRFWVRSTGQLLGQAERVLSSPIPGRHNLSNTLAAVAVARWLGMDWEGIQTGLHQYQGSAMRLVIADHNGVTIIDDSYNASPASVRAALHTLADEAGTRRRVAILGDMLELGERENELHYQLGPAIVAAGVSLLVAVGPRSRHTATGAEAAGLAGRICWVSDNQQALEVAREFLAAGDVVLVKGSRGMKMEEIVTALREE